MDRKKIIVLGIGASIILVLIIYIFSNALKDDAENKVTSVPVLQGQNNLTAEELMKNELENTKENNSVNENVVTEEELKNAILSNTKNGEQQQSTPATTYKPYGDRSMYTTEYDYTPPKRKKQRESYYEEEEEEEDFVEEEQKPKKIYSWSKNSKTNENRQGEQKPKKIYSWSKKGDNINEKEVYQTYKASIISTRRKYLTPENNRVQIRVQEEFYVKGIRVPKGMQLVAYANFSNELKLEIKSIQINNKQVPVSISIIDRQGQDAIEVIGGTGAEITDEAKQEGMNNTKTGNSIIDKAVGIFVGKRKPKAIVSSDLVYLRVND